MALGKLLAPHCHQPIWLFLLAMSPLTAPTSLEPAVTKTRSKSSDSTWLPHPRVANFLISQDTTGITMLEPALTSSQDRLWPLLCVFPLTPLLTEAHQATEPHQGTEQLQDQDLLVPHSSRRLSSLLSLPSQLPSFEKWCEYDPIRSTRWNICIILLSILLWGYSLLIKFLQKQKMFYNI